MPPPSSELTASPSDSLPPKTATGIAGLDEILLGGLPAGRTTLVRGGPGTGKTVLALEFIYRGALRGEPGVYVSFEETVATLRQNARALDWDNVESLEQDGRMVLFNPDLPATLLQTGEFDIQGLLAILDGHIKKIGASRIVIDASDVLLRLFRTTEDREDQLFLLYQWLAKRKQTALLTLKISGEQPSTYDRHEYMADCVMHIDNRVAGQIATRRLRVIKYRGSGFLSNEFPCLIASGGMQLMPISRSELETHEQDQVSTGNSGLDLLLEGGYQSGTCILIAGSTGTGKSILASEFAVAATQRGERVLYVNFEEGLGSFIRGMRSAGLDLASPHEQGMLHILAALPEMLGSEEHLLRLFRIIEEFDPAHVVVDAISACQRMGSEAVAFDFLVRLLNHCRSRGVTCIYLNQVEPDRSSHWISGVGISSLIDALMVLEQKWPGGSHVRSLLIIKHRGNRHSHNYHSFRITDDGIVIDERDSVSSSGQKEPS